MRYSYLLLAILAAFMMLAIQSCSEATTGTEVGNEKIVTLFNTDGKTPVRNANVRVYSSDDTTHIPVFTTETDENGHYELDGEFTINKYYNIYAEADSLVSFQDSVIFGKDGDNIKNDTMNLAKTVSGIVSLEPNHNVQTVTIHVLGTFIKTGVEKDGTFALNKLAYGNYTIMCISTIDEYTPLYYPLTVSKETKAIPDTLKPVFTGIPIVTGLSAITDTAMGTVSLQWNKSDYFDLQDYRIFRTHGSSTSWPSEPLKVTTDTSYIDTLYTDSTQTDTNSALHYKYRVQITNNANTLGNPYKYLEVETISPKEAKKIISEHELFLNDDGSITLSATPGKWFGENPKVSWDIGNTGTFTEISGTDTTLHFPLDTFLVNHKCIVKVNGIEDRITTDTITVTKLLTYSNLPSITSGTYKHVKKVIKFNDQLLAFIAKSPSTDAPFGLASSSDGENWNIVADSISTHRLLNSVVINDVLYLLNYSDSYDDLWIQAISITSDLKVAIHKDLPIKELSDGYNLRYSYLQKQGDKIAFHNIEGSWLLHSDLSVDKEINPIDNLKWFISRKPVSTASSEYLVCTAYGPDNNRNPHILKKENDGEFIEVKSFIPDSTKESFWIKSPTKTLSMNKGVLLFRSDVGYILSDQVIYSENMVDWYKVGDLPKFEFSLIEVLNFKGKNLAFGSKGEVQSFN